MWLPSFLSHSYSGRCWVKDHVGPYGAITKILTGYDLLCLLHIWPPSWCGPVGASGCCAPPFASILPMVTLSTCLTVARGRRGASVVLATFLGAWGNPARCETPVPPLVQCRSHLCYTWVCLCLVANSGALLGFPGLLKTMRFLQQFKMFGHFT